MGAGIPTQLPKKQASWTILDEYLHALDKTCLEMGAECLPTGKGISPTSTRYFKVLRRDSRFDYLNGEITVDIKANDFEHPVGTHRHGLSSQTQVTTWERKEHEDWQAQFVKILNDQVAEIRRNYAQAASGTGDEQTKPTILQFALRHKYLIAGIILAVVITVASLLLFPDWARSNLTLVILFPVAFATATGVIADIRKAYE